MGTLKRQRVACWLGSIALVIAIPSALLAFAPFTPAIATVPITAPLGVVAFLLGAKRTGALATFWAIAAVISFPTMPYLAGTIAILAWIAGIVALPLMWHDYQSGLAKQSHA